MPRGVRCGLKPCLSPLKPLRGWRTLSPKGFQVLSSGFSRAGFGVTTGCLPAKTAGRRDLQML